MATLKQCDYCKQAKSDVHEVAVSVAILGVVRPTMPTGVQLVADTCTDCRPQAYTDLLKRVTAQLERDIPEHILMHDEADEQAALGERIIRTTPDTDERRSLQAQYDKRERDIQTRRNARARALGG